MKHSIDYKLENMTKKYETSDLHDNIKSHRDTIGYHALSFAVKSSQLGDEVLLGKSLDLARYYTSLNGMIMPNNLPAELYFNVAFNNFSKRKKSLIKEELVDKWKTLGTVKRTSNYHLTNHPN
ncbi:hypothetical protein HOA91_03605 [Candidatus Woesearchaeota archaeon]|jgi:hypothetical protein|nr:hypothetical protein [Candidatus Woesearchaeota archaeon]